MKRNIIFIVALPVILAGCTAPPPVTLDPKFWSHHQEVKVSLDHPVQASISHVGAQGILDYAINETVTSKFDEYLHGYKLTSINNLQNKFVTRLRQHGVSSSSFHQIDSTKLKESNLDDVKYAVNDFTPYAIKLKNNKLLLISTKELGAIRNYYGFIPLGAPKAICSIEGRLIDPKNNKIMWRYEAIDKESVSGKWDQPPSYPNFAKALNKAVSSCTIDLLDAFFDNAPQV